MGQAQPVDRAVSADQGRGMQVPDDRVVLDPGHGYRPSTSEVTRDWAMLIRAGGGNRTRNLPLTRRLLCH